MVSTDGLIGEEAKALLKKLSALMAEKNRKLRLEVCGHVNARMSIAIVRATHLLPTWTVHFHEPDEQSSPPVGRWCWAWPLQALALIPP
jgi:hypothetical protein